MLGSAGKSAGAGTYAGLIEKLDYLQTLGVNALELMPVHEFNELEYYGVSRVHETPVYSMQFWSPPSLHGCSSAWSVLCCANQA